MISLTDQEIYDLAVATLGYNPECDVEAACMIAFGVSKSQLSKIALALLAFTETRYSEKGSGYFHRFVEADGPVQKVLVSRRADDSPNM